MTSGRSTLHPGRFTPGNDRYLSCSRPGGPQKRSGRVRKSWSPLEFDPRTAQHLASHYAGPLFSGGTSFKGMCCLCTILFAMPAFPAQLDKSAAWMVIDYFFLIGNTDLCFACSSNCYLRTVIRTNCMHPCVIPRRPCHGWDGGVFTYEMRKPVRIGNEILFRVTVCCLP